MRRYFILAAAFLLQVCLGATYSWSVFVPPIRELTGVQQGIAQIPFTVFYFAFPATLLFSGRILERLGPRRSAMTGILLFGAGWIAGGLGGSLLSLAIGVGLLAGIGAGCAYIVPVTVGIRWFHRHLGLVTGVTVAGFALGAGLVGAAAESMMTGLGVTPYEALGILGLGYLVLGVPAAAQMTFPGDEDVGVSSFPSWRELVRDRAFRKLFVAMVAGLAAGFAVNANLKDLHQGADATVGVAAVSVFAIANATGRLVWGLVFDRLVASSAIRVNLAAQALLLALGFQFVVDRESLLVFAAIAGFNYGGVLVIYASTVARRWGTMLLGQIYGLLFVANIVASPAPMLAGFSLDLSGSFVPAFVALAIFAFGVTFVVTPVVDDEANDSSVRRNRT